MAQVIADRRDIDFVLYEQLARDCKIASLYEGTNGIQSMDLLGRKLGMKKGTIFLKLIEEMQDCIARAAEIPGLEQQALRLKLKDVAFYEGQLKSADYFINAVIPVTNGRMDSIKSGTPAAVEISEAAFGGV